MKKELIIKEIKDYVIKQDDYFKNKDEHTILEEFIEYYNDNIKTKTLEFKKLDSKTLSSYSQDEFNEEVEIDYVYEVSDWKETKLFWIFGTYDSWSWFELSDYWFVEKQYKVVYDYKIIEEEGNKEELKEKIKKILFEIYKNDNINYFQWRINKEKDESEIIRYSQQIEKISKDEYNSNINLWELEDIEYLEYEDDNYKLISEVYHKWWEWQWEEYYNVSELLLKKEDKKYLIKFNSIYNSWDANEEDDIELVREIPSIWVDFKNIITLQN